MLKGEKMGKATKGYMPTQDKIPPMPKGGSSRINWSAQNINFDELVPPPKGEVRINRLGTVVMSIETYNEYQNIAEGESPQGQGRF